MSQEETVTTFPAPPLARKPDAPPPYTFEGEGNLCDFCNQPYDRMWMFPFRGHCISTGLGRFEIKAGYWGACVMCRPHVERGELKLLVARVLTMIPANHELVTEDMWFTHVVVMYSVLLDCMMPEGPYLREARA
jgi:hypothetical protein